MKKIGIIGKSLVHSFSKKLFTEKFIREKIEGYAFEQFEIQSIEELPALLEKHPELIGLTVTIPYKSAVIPYLSDINITAEQIGAVNVLRIRRNGNEVYIKGYNTDFIGFMKTIPNKNWLDFKHTIILGNGGASLMVQFIMDTLKIPYIVVVRSKDVDAEEHFFTYDELSDELVANTSLIVNTTPLGTFPNIESKPKLPYHLLTPQHTLIDLVYNPTLTAFMKEGLERGATVYNGEKMLFEQAEAAWELISSEETRE